MMIRKFLATVGPGVVRRGVTVADLPGLPRLHQEAYADLLDSAEPYQPSVPMTATPCRPRPSQACRKINLKSRRSNRGVLCLYLRGAGGLSEVAYESGVEKGAAEWTAMQPGCLDLVEQQGPFCIDAAYQGKPGKPVDHYLDFVVVLTCGERLAVMCKDAREAAGARFALQRSAVEEALPGSMANRVITITDRTYSRGEAAAAAMVLGAMKFSDAEADAVVDKLIREMREPAMIGMLVARTCLGGRAFEAVLRALYARTLVAPLHERLTRFTVVRPGTDHTVHMDRIAAEVA